MQVINKTYMRSDCPVSYALDIFGDKWTFLIIRDLLQGKKFYKEFLNSKEGIATNILSDRLKKLESNDLIHSKIYQELKTKKEYTLTEKGKDLIPIIVDFMVWSDKYQQGLAVTKDFITKANNDRGNLISAIRSSLD